MILGFIGTGKISSSIICGIFKSKLKIKRIYISSRNKNIAKKIINTEKMHLAHFPYTPRNIREDVGPEAESILGNFDERLQCYTEEQAIEEAGRCMSCGMCFECDNCVIYCPQDAVFRVKKDKSTTGRYVDTDYAKCIGCHICADVCPTGYIDMALGDH